MEAEPSSTDRAPFFGISKEDIIRAIENDDDVAVIGSRSKSDVPDPSLTVLRDKVQQTMEAALDHKPTAGSHLDGYLQLNDALLALVHWTHDIEVQGTNALQAIEQSDARFEAIAERLRELFMDMLGALARLSSDHECVALFSPFAL